MVRAGDTMNMVQAGDIMNMFHWGQAKSALVLTGNGWRGIVRPKGSQATTNCIVDTDRSNASTSTCKSERNLYAGANAIHDTVTIIINAYPRWHQELKKPTNDNS